LFRCRHVAVGVNADGRREVLGMDIGLRKPRPSWLGFLRKLARRGLRGVKLVVFEAHEASKPPSPGSSLPLAALPCPPHAQRSGACRSQRRLGLHRGTEDVGIVPNEAAITRRNPLRTER
jgi:hypothetical protein